MGSEAAGIGVQWESDSAWGWGCSSLLVVRVPGIPGSADSLRGCDRRKLFWALIPGFSLLLMCHGIAGWSLDILKEVGDPRLRGLEETLQFWLTEV